jgi:hypothetical protein
MEYYDKLLTLGQHLSSERQFELYEFLRNENQDAYTALLENILKNKIAYRKIANAEIKFELRNGILRDYIREFNGEYCEGNRKIRIAPIGFNKKSKLINFFAQCDVDAISNFPIPSEIERTFIGFGILQYPFYSLEFYSQGKGKFRGLINKKNRISEIQKYIAKMNNLGLY